MLITPIDLTRSRAGKTGFLSMFTSCSDAHQPKKAAKAESDAEDVKPTVREE